LVWGHNWPIIRFKVVFNVEGISFPKHLVGMENRDPWDEKCFCFVN
jgi:hypothetical protein